MDERLTWEAICERYDRQWVELVDYDWPEEDAHPRSGVVRVHAATRAEFDDQADIDPPRDSAHVFVGRSTAPVAAATTRGYSRVLIEDERE